MVQKSTLAILAGIGILAAVFLGRPKVVKTVQEPIPFEVPRPVPQPVPIPFLNLDVAKDFLQSTTGPLFKQTGVKTELDFRSKQILDQLNNAWDKAAFIGGGAINAFQKTVGQGQATYTKTPIFERI